MFRDTDLVPTDIIAGFVLLRVKQKRESREQRRIELIAEQRLKYTSGKYFLTVKYLYRLTTFCDQFLLICGTDAREAFCTMPSWMSLEKAEHYMRLSLSLYSCTMVLFMNCITGIFKLIAASTCCACFR
jgi:sn1-specific diacylglycerol lipase